MPTEIPLFGFWWIWLLSAGLYIFMDVLLLRAIVPWLLDIFYSSKYYKRRHNHSQALPGHTVAVLTERIVIGLMGLVMATTGLIIINETTHDVMKARSEILLPAVYVFSFNFIHDLYRMYRTFKLSRLHYKERSTRWIILKMIRHKFSFVLHHVLLFTLGMIVAHPIMRRGLGDYFFGCAFLMEFTNPFVSVHFILKELLLEDTNLYKLNGAIAIIVHFITRILIIPFMYYSYVSQYHHGNWLSGVQEMRLVCHFTNGLGFVFQLYWFVRMIRLFVISAQRIVLNKK